MFCFERFVNIYCEQCTILLVFYTVENNCSYSVKLRGCSVFTHLCVVCGTVIFNKV